MSYAEFGARVPKAGQYKKNWVKKKYHLGFGLFVLFRLFGAPKVRPIFTVTSRWENSSLSSSDGI